MRALAQHHCLWMILSVLIALTPSAPCSEVLQTPNWKETTVYASAGGKNKDKGNLFRIRVLRSNPQFSYIISYRGLSKIPPSPVSLNVEAIPIIPFPENVQKILDLDNDRKAFEKYKSTTGWFDYSYTDPRGSSSFFFQDAGDVFLLQKNQGTKTPVFQVKHDFQNFHIHKCSLDARNGLIPIAYSRKGGTCLGLVSVKTGQLKELGRWAPEGFYDCLKWIDDNHIVLTFSTRKSCGWAVYDINAKKVVVEGITELTINPEDEFINEFTINNGQLFGLLNRYNNISVRLLFPSPAQSSPSSGSNPEK